jgi:[ribosomal protein S5]-alanine N-acetyltransferase
VNKTEEILFETPRLSVRHFQRKDLDDFAALCADPEVMRYVGDGTTLDRAEVDHWIEVCQNKYRDRGYGTSAVFEKTSNTFTGYCGVVRAPEREFDELIYVYHASTWGKGYATEAGQAMLEYVFGLSILNKIYATIHADNEASVKVAQKLGMSFEKRELEPDGTYTLYYLKERDTRSALDE